jgi:hypothetical protein
MLIRNKKNKIKENKIKSYMGKKYNAIVSRLYVSLKKVINIHIVSRSD